jgi:predicted ATPase
MTLVTQFRRRLDPLLAEFRFARRQAREERSAHRTAVQEVQDAAAAQALVQDVAEAVQGHAHRQLASVVTRCLAAVFDDPYTFEIIFTKSRGKTEARFQLSRDGLVLDDPPNQCGGGVLDVAAFALRIACLMLSTPRRRRLLLLDEPLRHLHSPVYRKRARELIMTLAEEMKVQVIMTTGMRELMCGKVISLDGEGNNR